MLADLGVGLFQGFWITKLRVPSFVVTLAGLLAWQGALLYVLGAAETLLSAQLAIVGSRNATAQDFGTVLQALRAALADLVVGPPLNRTAEVGGPERIGFDALARRLSASVLTMV